MKRIAVLSLLLVGTSFIACAQDDTNAYKNLYAFIAAVGNDTTDVQAREFVEKYKQKEGTPYSKNFLSDVCDEGLLFAEKKLSKEKKEEVQNIINVIKSKSAGINAGIAMMLPEFLGDKIDGTQLIKSVQKGESEEVVKTLTTVKDLAEEYL